MLRAFSSVVAILAVAALVASAGAEPAPPATKKTTRPLLVALVDAGTGQPLTGATVTLRESAKYKTPRPVDDRGRVTIEVPADWAYVSVLCRKDGYATTSAYWQNMSTCCGVMISVTTASPVSSRAAARSLSPSSFSPWNE